MAGDLSAMGTFRDRGEQVGSPERANNVNVRRIHVERADGETEARSISVAERHGMAINQRR